MNIEIKSIPHEEQRYETCGDYWDYPDGKEVIRVSKLSDWRREFLIAFHEMFEKAVVRHLGISEESITAFDLKFEQERREGIRTPEEEPGDCVTSPYWLPHQIATGIERIAAGFLGVDWNDYEREVVSLINGKISMP